jgi:hypothetical protein
MSSQGYIPEPLSPAQLRKLVLDAIQDNPNPETYHALYDHPERGITTDDVVHALEGNWTIARKKFNKDEWQWKYEIDGFTIDDVPDPITIIIAVDTLRKEFVVVTRWRTDE